MRTKHFTIWVVYILFNMTACSFHQKDYVGEEPFDSGYKSGYENNSYEIDYDSPQGSRSSKSANGKDEIPNLHLPSTSTGVSETNATQPAQETNKKKKWKKIPFNFKKNKHSNNSDSGLEESEDEDDGEDDYQGCNEVKTCLKYESRKEKKEKKQRSQKIKTCVALSNGVNVPIQIGVALVTGGASTIVSAGGSVVITAGAAYLKNPEKVKVKMKAMKKSAQDLYTKSKEKFNNKSKYNNLDESKD
ncbi:hypothetical protein [Cardinium endosymbiont of Sogatella furcifera]|uniref:hypothetical protein n=1 Tax=Cardinium endosymbiont of Sogatella furcifera TaxID=650378 RepID=UPI000E0D11C7|nr:hypothetical protein [Cardinium endosymbiont of Sogatella furcifera]